MQSSISPERWRENAPWLRWTLLLAAGLVFVTGLQLIVVTGKTEDYFAWTIKPPLTAAFLGAGYWAACVLLVLCARERLWVNIRAAVVAVAVFVPLMFSATLIHLDRFHLGAGSATARAAGWGWLVFYIAVVIAVPVALAAQLLLVRGHDPEPRSPLARGLRLPLTLQGLVLVGIGVPLYLFPGTVGEIWPWELTPLTGRAVASWLVGVGVAALAAVRENDYVRIRPLLVSYVALGALQLIGVVRFTETPDWDGPSIWLYVAFLASMVLVGACGSFAAGTANRSASAVAR